MKKFFIAAVMLFLCSTMLFASKIDGKWAASIDTDNGTFEFTLTYKVGVHDKFHKRLLRTKNFINITFYKKHDIVFA